jgi:hypothetical protein
MAVKLCLSDITEYQWWFYGYKDKPLNAIRGDYDGALGCGGIVKLPKRKLRIPEYDKPFLAPKRGSSPDSVFIRKKVRNYFGGYRTEYREYDLNENLIATWRGISVSDSNWSYL